MKTVQRNKYNINHNFFETIDSPECAYILGWMFSDGYNSVNKGFARLKIQISDREILDAINTILENESPLIFGKRNKPHHKDTLSLYMYSKQITKDLSNHGCHQNKTFSLTWPNHIDENLIPHFIRGLWDGDGFIGKDAAVFVGTESMCLGIRRYIKKITGCEALITNNSSSSPNELSQSIKRLVINKGLGLKTFLDSIYKDATIYLKRKYSNYQKILNFQNQHWIYNDDGTRFSEEQMKERNKVRTSKDYISKDKNARKILLNERTRKSAATH